MTIDERRERAARWLQIIYTDVQDLLIDSHIFWEVQAIIRQNPLLVATRSHFSHWMMAAHVEATVMGVRRQVKSEKNSISLRRFLKELIRYPEIASRAHYI